MTIRRFSLGAVLTLTTGILAGDFAEAHDLTEHLTGLPVMTHELPHVWPLVVPGLLEQFPALRGIAVPQSARDGGGVGMDAWVCDVAAETHLGLTVEVAQLELDPATMKAARLAGWTAFGFKAVD